MVNSKRVELLSEVLSRLPEVRTVGYLGSGTFGDTFRIQKGPHTLSVKVFKNELTNPSRIEREIRALKKVNHRHVARYVDDGAVTLPNGEVCRYLAYEFVEGVPVRHFLGKTIVKLPELSAFASGMLKGLQCIHALSLVHRDLSANNIILKNCSWDLPVIIDFGWSRHLDLPALTTYPAVTGTLPFMAPEQLQGKEATSFCDLWALGVNIYWLATGRHPYIRTAPHQPSCQTVLADLMQRGIEWPTSIAAQIGQLLRVLLSIEAVDRTTAKTLVSLLSTWGAHET